MTREEQDELYVNNERLAYAIVNAYYPTWSQDDDVVQSARIGLWKACTIFDEKRAKFSTLATVCVKREVGHYLRSLNKKSSVNNWECFSLDSKFSTDYDMSDIDSFYEFLPAKHDIIWVGDKLKDLLTPRQYQIFVFLMNDLSSRAIGQKLGVSHQTILDEKRRIIRIIKDNLIDI